MFSESNQLVSYLLKHALPNGGWSVRDDKPYEPSITVTSEVTLALAEHIEQTLVPWKDEEKKKRAGQIDILTKSIDIVVRGVKNRKKTELDVINCAMVLAAYCQYRALGIRESIKLPRVDKPLIEKLLDTLASLQSETSTGNDIGVAWAYLRAIQLVHKTKYAVEDKELWKALEKANPKSGNDINNVINTAYRTTSLLLDKVVAGDRSIANGYEAAVIMDIAVGALRFGSAIINDPERENSTSLNNAVAVITKCLEYIFNNLKNFSARGRFPVNSFDSFSGHLFSNDNRRASYTVATQSTLLNCFAFLLLHDDDIPSPSLTNDELVNIQLYFYTLAGELKKNIRKDQLGVVQAAHCIRVLSEIQLSDRENTHVKDIILREERAKNRNFFDKEFTQEVASFLESAVTRIGKPSNRWWFFCASDRLFFSVFGFLFIMQVTAILSLGINYYAISAISITLSLLVTLVPFCWVAHANGRALNQRDERSRSKIILSFIIFVIISVIPAFSTIALALLGMLGLLR